MSEADESQGTPEAASGSGVPAASAATERPKEENKDARTWGMLAHISAILALVIGLPFVGPLIVWLVKKDEHPFVDDQGKEALNFQILLMIVYVVLIIVTVCTMGLGALLFIPVGLAAIVLNIMAGIKANEGVWYRYPFNWRLIK